MITTCCLRFSRIITKIYRIHNRIMETLSNKKTNKITRQRWHHTGGGPARLKKLRRGGSVESNPCWKTAKLRDCRLCTGLLIFREVVEPTSGVATGGTDGHRASNASCRRAIRTKQKVNGIRMWKGNANLAAANEGGGVVAFE